jgi:hypothetical protein
MGKRVEIIGDPISFMSIVRNIPRDKWIFSGDLKFPIVECPNCGDGMLGDFAPHGIHEDGRVYNSVVCQREGCDFHNHIKLEGWNFGAIPRGDKNTK